MIIRKLIHGHVPHFVRNELFWGPLRFSNPYSFFVSKVACYVAITFLTHSLRLSFAFASLTSILLFFNFLYSQNPLPSLDYHSLYENSNQITFVWLTQKNSNGIWLLEHSFNGLHWHTIQKYSTPQNLYYHSFPKNLYGFIRLRWVNSHDTTTLTVHNLNYLQKKGLFAYYDTLNCKVSIGYQIPYSTDLLLRLYNSIGEEIATHFLYHQPYELVFWNFEPDNIKNDIYLVRLVDALTKEILLDYRLPIFYGYSEKTSN